MAAPTNHWKLGLFVVVSLFAAVSVGVYLSAQSLRKATVEYLSYFDESVQGLEVGAPVKFRGVTIGNVSLIDVASDRRHVEVTYSMTVKTLSDMKLSRKEGRQTQLRMPPDMRAQIASAGITGIKFITIDYFSEKDYPPPSLPFPVPENYIPGAPSTMKNLEDAVVKTVNQIPDLAQALLQLMSRINHFVGELDNQRLPVRVSETLQDLQTAVKAMNTAKLSTEAQGTLAGINAAVGRFDVLLTRLESDKGLLVSALRASDAFGETARGARGVGRQMDMTLRDVSEAAQSLRKLVDALEQDPDMLLKGRIRKAP